MLFALTPAAVELRLAVLNGLPLGMVFGLVLGFLEGRRHTEALTAGLCASFIVADGVDKSVGAYLLEAGVSEYWMPFAAGLLFVAAAAAVRVDADAHPAAVDRRTSPPAASGRR